MPQPLDVLIIGAGISGIALGCELAKLPGLDFKILDKRERVGGTWDIFTYPGVRSDSEMDSYCFSFEPWRGSRPLGKGAEIRNYLEQTARKHGLLERIDFGVRATRATWSSASSTWTVHSDRGAYEARFLHVAAGYFNQEHGYIPDFPGRETFRGRIVEPQRWPADLAWQGKDIVVIGSGATAATLVPELAQAANVTMLQRTPSHMAPLPNHQPFDALNTSARVRRARAILGNQLIIRAAQHFPALTAKALSLLRARLLPEPLRHHFEPDYPVWEQRVCRIPDGDLFRMLAAGNAQILTDTVAQFTPSGILTGSGVDVPADIIVLATGLQLQALGGLTLEVDGTAVDVGTRAAYRGTLLADVPNLTFTLGYVNESFTLRAELVAAYVRRLVAHMRAGRLPVVRASGQPRGKRKRIIDLNAGYVQRGIAAFPYVTDQEPWALHNDHFQEMRAFGSDEFSGLDFGFQRLGTQQLRARIYGPADGHPIVLIHGIGRSLEDFDQLDVPGARLIALDLPGFGDTAALANPTMSGVTAAVWDAIDSLQLPGKITLVGNSLGGAIAMRMSIQRPDSVERVVLIAPSGFSEEITSSVALAAGKAGPALLEIMGGPMLRKVEETVVADSSLVGEYRLRIGRHNARRPDHVRTFIALSRELVAVPAQQRTGVAASFAALNLPVDLVWGSADAVLEIGQLAQARALLPQASVHEFPGVGHIVQLERASEVSQLLQMR
ncbi:alpha/beta fold hydrolase [Corynebacterium sp. H127]|uniref:alpha/beta fold hydrolase n=1 Tax=Corynebacterium sp. H127 TaxID=3133418 RepID=UPI0030A2A514